MGVSFKVHSFVTVSKVLEAVELASRNGSKPGWPGMKLNISANPFWVDQSSSEKFNQKVNYKSEKM